MGRYVKINGELVPIADIESSQNTNFVGTLTDWEALTTEQKNAYDSVDLIDDFSDEITEELDALNDRVGDAESNITSINSQVSSLTSKVSCIVNETASFQTSYQIPRWSRYHNGLIIGMMDSVGNFVGSIYGTTYTKIAGADMTNNISLSISNDGTLTISSTSTYRFTCTVIRGR